VETIEQSWIWGVSMLGMKAERRIEEKNDNPEKLEEEEEE
jgi:hypothetical protein